MQTTHHMIRELCRDENDQLQWADVKVELRIDHAAIARELGVKALRNKSRKSKLALGVTAEIVHGIPKGWRRTHL